MARYHNQKETIKIGNQIRKLRKDALLSIDDISDMTGFAKSTISAIENGSETDTSHLIEIAKAIGIHPQKIFDISINIKPRFKLSQKRKEQNHLTHRITTLFEETDFFDNPKFVKEIIQKLSEEYSIKPNPTETSVAMRRLVQENKVQYHKSGRQNQYFRKK